MSSSEMLQWIFQDSISHKDYSGIMEGPHTKLADVSDKLKKLQEKDDSLGKDKIKKFIKGYTREGVLDYIDDLEVTPLNDDWVGDFETELKTDLSKENIEYLTKRLAEEGGAYKTTSVNEVTKLLRGVAERLELIDEIKSATTFEAIPDVGRAELRRKYGREEGNKIIAELDRKIDTFETISEKVSRELSEKINTATPQDISSLRTEIIDQTQLVSDEERLLKELARKQGEFNEGN